MDESEIETPEVQDLGKVKDLDRAQYESGFQEFSKRVPFDGARSPAWQLGWHSAARQTEQDKS
jgi:hypothetical protein